MPEITKLVLTGGNAEELEHVRREAARCGYAVLTVPADPAGDPELQLERENACQRHAEALGSEKVLLVCLGGVIDCLAGMAPEAAEAVLRENGREAVSLRDSYDAVFCLNGPVKAWVGHPHLRLTPTPDRLLRELDALLGDLEIERKFLVEYPDQEALERDPLCRGAEIVQTYLIPQEGEETVRVRRRGEGESCVFTLTSKRALSDGVRRETERRISPEEYRELLRRADPARRPVRKTRYCLVYAGQYFELDVYPFWHDRALLEIELPAPDTPVTLPDTLRLIREVTGEREYLNSEIAKTIG